MKHRYTISLIASLFCIISAGQSMPFMSTGTDIAGLGMGSVSVASNASAFSADGNIAAAALSEKRMEAEAGYSLWQPEVFCHSIPGLGIYYRTGNRVAVGLSGKYLIEKEYGIIGEDGIESNVYRPKEGLLSIGASYRIIDGLAVGAGLKVAFSKIAPNAGSTVFAADIHAIYSIKGVNIAFGVSNIGNKADYGNGKYGIPTMLRTGVAYSIAGFTCNAEADWQFGAGIMASAGAEYSILDIVDIRAGYHYGQNGTVLPTFASVGLGFEFFGVNLDAAYLISAGAMKNTFSVGLGYSF